MFLPAPEDAATPYLVQPISLPPTHFGSGDYAFLNYSGGTIGCKINNERLLIEQGKCGTYKSLREKNDTTNRTILCYEKNGERWETVPFSSSRLIV